MTGDYSTSTCRRPLDPYSLAYGQVYHSHTGCTRVLCRAGSSSPGIPDDNNEARPLCERHDAAAFVVPSPSTLELKKRPAALIARLALRSRSARHGTRAHLRDVPSRIKPYGLGQAGSGGMLLGDGAAAGVRLPAALRLPYFRAGPGGIRGVRTL